MQSLQLCLVLSINGGQIERGSGRREGGVGIKSGVGEGRRRERRGCEEGERLNKNRRRKERWTEEERDSNM